MKLLVVDDESLIRNVIKEYALNEGYTVDEAEDGNEAIEKVEENNYDLKGDVILNYHTVFQGWNACDKTGYDSILELY